MLENGYNLHHKFYGGQNAARSVKILKLFERSEFFKIRIEDDFGRKHLCGNRLFLLLFCGNDEKVRSLGLDLPIRRDWRLKIFDFS